MPENTPTVQPNKLTDKEEKKLQEEEAALKRLGKIYQKLHILILIQWIQKFLVLIRRIQNFLIVN